MASITVHATARTRKLAIKFKVGQPLPVTRPQLLARRSGSVRVAGTDRTTMIDAAMIADPYRGVQVGQLVDRPRKGSQFTRTVVSAFAKHEAAAKSLRGTMRRHATQARAHEEQEHVEAFAYLEALADLDAAEDAADDVSGLEVPS